MKRFTTLAVLLLLAGVMNAQEDISGAQDHPLFSRMNKFIIDEYSQKEYDAAQFIVPKTPGAQDFTRKSVEGKKTVIRYHLKEETTPAVSKLQVIRNYTSAAKKIGGSIIFDGGGKDWANVDDGGVYFVWDVTMKFAKTNGEIWAGIEFDNSVLEPDIAFFLTIVETAEMKQEVLGSSELLTALNTLGRVAVYINFASGKATINAESMPVIDEIEKLLKDNPTLKLRIEGHTDNIGKPEANQKLSDERAKSVLNELVKRGVPNPRVTAKGFGQTKPLEENTTEEGRARNRRVELVNVK